MRLKALGNVFKKCPQMLCKRVWNGQSDDLSSLDWVAVSIFWNFPSPLKNLCTRKMNFAGL